MTNQQKMQVAALYAKEKDLKKVAKKSHLPEDEVRAFLISRGKTELEGTELEGTEQPPENTQNANLWKTMSEDERQVVIDEYNNGVSTYVLARKYGVERMKLTSYLKEHGVVMRGRGPVKKSKPTEEDTRTPVQAHDLVRKSEPVKEETPKQKPEENKPATVTLPHPLPSLVQSVAEDRPDKDILSDITYTLKTLSGVYDGLTSKQQAWFDVGESYGRLCCLADELERRIKREHPDDND